MNKAASTKRPLTVILVLVELSEEPTSRKLAAGQGWLPREGNQGADDLGNMKTGDVDESRRIQAATADLTWRALGEMMQASHELNAAIC